MKHKWVTYINVEKNNLNFQTLCGVCMKNFMKEKKMNNLHGYVEVPEDYWESTTTNNEDFEFIYNEKELSDIYI
jgi:hypothetical protein